MPPIHLHRALAVLSLAVALPAAAQDPFRWSGRVAAGDEVEVIGIAATVQATPARGDRVEVTATGLRDGARIEVEQHAGGVTFCIVPAGTRRTGEGRCSVQGRGENRRRWNREEIAVQVRLPGAVDFAARTVSGEIRAEGLGGDVEAQSVSGNVHVSTRGMAEAQSVSGNVSVAMGRLPARGRVELRSVSGDVEVSLPAGADAEVRGNTLSGEIRSDFPLEVTGRERGSRGWPVRVGSRVRGTLGDGGTRLELETVSGDIRVRRSGR